METIEMLKKILDGLGIEWAVVLLYICSGLIVKSFFQGKITIPFTKRNITDAWRVLILGSIVVAVYVLIEYRYPNEFTRMTLKKLFVSYIFTTSFYELVLKDTVAAWIVGLFEKIKVKKNNDDTPIE